MVSVRTNDDDALFGRSCFFFLLLDDSIAICSHNFAKKTKDTSLFGSHQHHCNDKHQQHPSTTTLDIISSVLAQRTIKRHQQTVTSHRLLPSISKIEFVNVHTLLHNINYHTMATLNPSQQQEQQRDRQLQTKQRPSYRKKALYLSLTCSLLGVAAAGPSSSVAAAAFVSKSKPATPEKSTKRTERNSNVRLFSALPLTCKKSLQHLDQKQNQQNAKRRSSTTSSSSSFQPSQSPSQLNSAATFVLEDYSTVVDDPFDPNFRPSPTWEDTWGQPPTATSTTTKSSSAYFGEVAALPVEYIHDAAHQFRIFCDLDGVLCDFEHGVQTICRRSTHEIAKTTMWQAIAKSNVAFFENLRWTRDGRRLWNAIRHLKPDILTGVPDLANARIEKYNWCRQNLGMQEYRHVDMAGDGFHHANVNGNTKACKIQDGPITNVITCWSYNKHHESGQHALLIDDRIELKAKWEANGGIFVHHTDAETTLQKLEQLGVPISSIDDDNDDEVNERNLPRP